MVAVSLQDHRRPLSSHLNTLPKPESLRHLNILPGDWSPKPGVGAFRAPAENRLPHLP